jgi:uncharacterized protein DUF4276
MKRILIHVEGQTEEIFVNEALAPHLYACGYEAVSARLLGNERNRSRRGGIRGWNTARNDILNHLREDQGCVATTMVDYYALPREGQGAWPGRQEAGSVPFTSKASTLQAALSADICSELGDNFDSRRFVPYVIMHEFEGLLFSDCEKFANGIARPDLRVSFQHIRDGFATPEEINDSPITAPSKRVQTLVPSYEKPLFGALAVLAIGLDRIREECPNFRHWIETLEALPA